MDQLLKMKRYDTALYPENDPRYPVQQAILEAYSAQPDFERLKPFFTKRTTGRLCVRISPAVGEILLWFATGSHLPA